jgi:hypothetical protein
VLRPGTEPGAIVDALLQTAHANPHHVAITGARGIGKTSALHIAARIAEGDRLLLERLSIDTGDLDFKMLPGCWSTMHRTGLTPQLR